MIIWGHTLLDKIHCPPGNRHIENQRKCTVISCLKSYLTGEVVLVTNSCVYVFSKSVLDIRTRLVVTVEPETKWMPNSDSASKRMPECKIWGQDDLPNYFYSCLTIAVF